MGLVRPTAVVEPFLELFIRNGVHDLTSVLEDFLALFTRNRVHSLDLSQRNDSFKLAFEIGCIRWISKPRTFYLKCVASKISKRILTDLQNPSTATILQGTWKLKMAVQVRAKALNVSMFYIFTKRNVFRD